VAPDPAREPRKTLLLGGKRVSVAYSKRDAQPESLTEGFDFQRYENDCEPCQIHNVLSELARRHRNTRLPIPYGDSLRLCRYNRVLGIRELSVLPGFKTRLQPAGYRPRELERCAHWTRVTDVLRDEYCSLPLISVSERYWTRVAKPAYLRRFEGSPESRDLDHVLVVLSVSSAGEVALYDSFQGQLSRGGYSLLGDNLLPSQSIVRLPIKDVLEYWRDARYKSPWVWWVEPLERERAIGLQQTLKVQ
jgi:hypothetical protein